MIVVDDTLFDVQQNASVREILSVEPHAVLLLKTAALYTDYDNRWQMYSHLKRQASHLVGNGAARPELATTRHYEAMIWAIDRLLPDTSNSLMESEE